MVLVQVVAAAELSCNDSASRVTVWGMVAAVGETKVSVGGWVELTCACKCTCTYVHALPNPNHNPTPTPTPNSNRLVPEKTRATIYNLYRIPLNAVVLGVLLSGIGVATAFGCCVGLLAACAIAQHLLARRLLPAGQLVEGPRLLVVSPPTDGAT